MHRSLCSYILNISSVIVQKKKRKSLNISGPLLNLKLNFLGSNANHQTLIFHFIHLCDSRHARTAWTAMGHGVSPEQDLFHEVFYTHKAWGSFHAGFLLCV